MPKPRKHLHKVSMKKADREYHDKWKQCNSVDNLDGGLYLGYVEPEDGKYGSLPMYDDYSEDSFPDHPHDE